MATDMELQELVAYLPLLRRLAAQDTTLADAAGKSTTMKTDTAATVQAEMTFRGVAVKVEDGSGNLIHAFGAKS